MILLIADAFISMGFKTGIKKKMRENLNEILSKMTNIALEF